MPIVKVRGGYKATPTSRKVHKTRAAADRQLRAIKARQRAGQKRAK